MVYDYYCSGSRDQITLLENENAYKRIFLLPRVLRDVSVIDISSDFFGVPISSPLMVAATAMHKLIHPDGEMATAKACSNTNTLMMLSSLSTTTLEEVAETPGLIKIFQLYVTKDREFAKKNGTKS